MKIKALIATLTIFFALSNTKTFAISHISNDSTIIYKSYKEKAALMSPEQKQARIDEMKARVKEIKAMDKSQLTKEQRKALRQELRDMNKEARAMGTTYVYISVGGLILIIILLILILH